MWRWVVLSLLLPSTAWAQCTLAEVEDVSDADLTIYFTKFLGEDESEGRFADCVLIPVRKADETTETFWVSPFRQDADWIVHPSNFPN